MDDYGDSELRQVLRNIDFLQLYEFFTIKNGAIENLRAWNLEQAYLDLRLLRIEIDPKLDDDSEDKKELDALMTLIENDRNKFTNGEIDKGEYYFKLEDTMMVMQRLAKKHGFFYKEAEDDVGL